MDFKVLLKFGLAMGLGFCAYTTIMWLTRLDTTYLAVGHYFDIAILCWPIAMIFLAIRASMRSGKVSVIKRISIAIIVSLISFIIYAPFLFLYHNYINPTWFDSVLFLRESQMVASNADGSRISEELRRMKEINAAQSGILNGFLPSVVILPFLVSLVSIPFIRNKKVQDEHE